MTPLFQKSVLKGQLRNLKNAPAIKAEIEAAWERFTDYFHNPKRQEYIRKTNEEQFQEGFLDALFVKVLGYTRNPNPDYNLTTELKNPQDGKKADGALLNPKNGKPLGVIELKDYKTTDLTRVENQAFGYHSSHPTSRYIVISNFEKLRFYIDKRNAYEEFNLFTLTQERFEVLWFCLSHYSLTRQYPQQAQEISVTSEEEVTRKLYADYANFRDALFDDLRHHNPEHDPLTLFKKAQKLLDRIIFVLFAEDRGLIEANTSRTIVDEWIRITEELELEMSLYQNFQRYFSWLNRGSRTKIRRHHMFYGYNGGLFAEDPLLDQLQITDEILKEHILELAHYDYQSEVSVNILGHIFEHSISEIEEIQEEIETSETLPKLADGSENPSAKSKTVAEGVKPSATPPRFADGSKNRRKRDGVFYTPAYITRYIIESTLGRMCEEKKKELGILTTSPQTPLPDERGLKNAPQAQKNFPPYGGGTEGGASENPEIPLEVIAAYRDWLLSLTICDPACGSGAFLVQALDFLLEEHRYLDELEAKHAPKAEEPQGFDLMSQPAATDNTEPIENQILRRNLYGVDLNPESVEIAKLSLWIHTAKRGQKLTFLSDNLKSGNSLIDDPEVAGAQAFNWQNEFPHIFEKGGFDVVVGNPPYLGGRDWKERHGRDYNFFTENYSVAEYQFDIYVIFWEKGIRILNSSGLLGFITPITWLNNQKTEKLRNFLLTKTQIVQIVDLSDRNVFSDAVVLTMIGVLRNEKPNNNSETDILVAGNDKSNVLFPKASIKQSVWLSQPLKIINFNLNKGDIAIIEKLEKVGEKLENYALVKFGIKIYETGKGTPPQNKSDAKNKIFESDNKVDESYRPYLRGKDIDTYQTNYAGIWLKYGQNLAAPRDPDLFEGERLLIRRIVGKRLIATFTEEDFVTSQLLQIVKPNTNISSKCLLTIINSKLLAYYFRKKYNRLDKVFPEIRVYELSSLPIAFPSDPIPFITLADRMLDLHASQQAQIDRFLRRVGDNLLGEKPVRSERPYRFKPSKKMQQFYLHDFQTFLSELKKKKVKLTLSQQDEWEPYFEESKAAIVAQQAEIDQTDREIDALVYELYGLTEEEIRIVEGA